MIEVFPGQNSFSVVVVPNTNGFNENQLIIAGIFIPFKKIFLHLHLCTNLAIGMVDMK